MKEIIGLTGGYCSGKNQAAAILKAKGYHIIDVDGLGHEALETCTESLVKAFGDGILNENGAIDRKALGKIVFSNPERLRLHESIVHPVMLGLLDKELAAREKACINAALLYRFPQAKQCDFILEIRAPLAARIRRGKRRDGLSAIDIMKRLWSQRYLWKLRPQNRPPVFFVDNRGDITDLRNRLEAALKRKLSQ